MKTVHLGRTGLQVGRLALGTMNFGPETSEEESFRIMDAAVEAGINLFDTANVYGKRRGEGVTEKIVGRWLAQGGGRREKIVLATKVYGPMGPGPNDARLSAYHLRRACDDSLRRLQTDVIDLWQMHHVWREASWEEIWQAMENLVRQGKVLYVGSSNFAGWHLAQAQETARARHFLGLASEQSLYNLLQRTVELEVLPACRAYGLGVLPWSPLAGGLLAGGGPGVRRETEAVRAKRKANEKALGEFDAFCRTRGETPANVALAWLLHQPAVTAPILGPRTVDQLTGALRAAELALSADDLAALDRVFPGPGGAAPEAYAW